MGTSWQAEQMNAHRLALYAEDSVVYVRLLYNTCPRLRCHQCVSVGNCLTEVLMKVSSDYVVL